MRRNASISLLAVGHACVDIYQGAVAALIPFFVAERHYGYAVASGIALSGSYGLTLAFVAVSGVGVAAYHPESARLARLASGGSHSAMSWFSLGGNIGFALAPVMVSLVIGHGSLRWTPLLALPALVGASLCVPVLGMLGRRQAGTAGTSAPTGEDDVSSFVRLSLAVVCRSVVFTGLSTFIALYARQRTGGGTTAGTVALFLLFLGGAVGSVLGGALAGRYDRVRVCRWSYLLSVAAVAGVLYVPGPAMFLCVALTSAGLYVPFSLQVTLGQDYLPSRVGTASGVTLGLTVSVGGLVSPLLGHLADTTSLRTALTPLTVLPALSALLFATLPEPAAPRPQQAVPIRESV
ncbi:MFS transporter [Streptomyces sp. NPDC048202]|uniref:MFS transporter n=1 Tax=Streptomyces sp. NPDC048202 TaxID=3365514 RepID=UPI003714695F